MFCANVTLRYVAGAFTGGQWTGVYKQAYENLLPSGWIEQIESSTRLNCNEGTLPEDSLLSTWGSMFERCCEKMGKNISIL